MFAQYYTKQRHNRWTLRNNLSNGVLIVKIGYVLTDLQAIKDKQNFTLHG